MVTVKEMARFSIEAPRYTSYPTAAEFSSTVGEPDYRRALANIGAAGDHSPLALYVHLPFCREICHFCGCHALIARTPERIDRYLGALALEAGEVARAMGPGRRFGELHFGGGSPSLLEPDAFERLMRALRAAFSFGGHASLSIEADPRTTDEAKLERYRALGIDRISFGFQDLDDGVQRAIGRNQSAEVSRRAFGLARLLGFESINVDLCYGLPGQTAATFARTVAEVIALRPDRVAIFGYAHVPWMKPMQRLIDASTLPRAELRLHLLADAREALVAAGYRAIGLDHFALPADELAKAAEAGTLQRNFQGYTTTRAAGLIGLGLSAISDLPGGYFQNERALPAYYKALERTGLAVERGVYRTIDDQLRGEIIRDLMCRFRLDIADISRRHGIDFAARFAAEMAELHAMAADGLVRVTEAAVELTALGAVFVRNVARVFDAYRRVPSAARPRFSMTS